MGIFVSAMSEASCTWWIFVSAMSEASCTWWIFVSAMSEASCTWSGKIPQKNYRSPASFSCKVFLGGVPWDITEGMCGGIFEFGVHINS